MIRQQSPLRVLVGAGRREQRWRAPAVCLVLAAITFAVFGQTAGFGFVNYDDQEYVYQNPMVAKGFDPERSRLGVDLRKDRPLASVDVADAHGGLPGIWPAGGRSSFD